MKTTLRATSKKRNNPRPRWLLRKDSRFPNNNSHGQVSICNKPKLNPDIAFLGIDVAEGGK